MSQSFGVVLPHLHLKYDYKNGSFMDHLKLYSRLPQLPPSLFPFHSFLVAVEDKASEGSASGLTQPLLFSVDNRNHIICSIKTSLLCIHVCKRVLDNVKSYLTLVTYIY